MLAILAFVVLVSQTVRHAYLLSQPGLEEMYAREARARRAA